MHQEFCFLQSWEWWKPLVKWNGRSCRQTIDLLVKTLYEKLCLSGNGENRVSGWFMCFIWFYSPILNMALSITPWRCAVIVVNSAVWDLLLIPLFKHRSAITFKQLPSKVNKIDYLSIFDDGQIVMDNWDQIKASPKCQVLWVVPEINWLAPTQNGPTMDN